MTDETLPPGKGSTAGPDAALNLEAASIHDPSQATLPPPGPSPVNHGTLVPGDPAAAVAVRPVVAESPLPSLPSDSTLGGTDPAATQAYHKAAMEAAPKAAASGTAFGDYELLGAIAKGGMGIVYKARQRKLNRVVAIKMILAGQFADQTDIDRFYAEAEAAAALSHPNIVAIHEVGEINGQHFFSMDFIDGQSLSDLVRENPLRPRRAAEFVRTIAETMQFAHESGVVHRDLKPANVLLDKRQRPLITDFGLAKHVSDQSQRTIAGSIVGTPSYMPPEQASGKIEEIGPWSDLYSLGAILYELLTGRPPFRSASPFETIRQVLETEPLSPRMLNEVIPRDLETICLKCLQKSRLNRYASAQELADELGRFLRGEPIHARPISQFARFVRLCKRHPITSAAIAAAILILIGATGVSTVFGIQTSRALVKSEESLGEARKAVNDMFTMVSEDTLLNEPGMQLLRGKLLGKTKEYFERFLMQRDNDPRVAGELAGTYFRLGKIAALLQAPDDAIKPYEKAREMQERLLAKLPTDSRRRKALGDTINALGELRYSQHDFEAARREFDVALKIRGELTEASKSNGEYQRELANTHQNSGITEFADGKYPVARREFEAAQGIRQAALKITDQDPALRARLQRDLGMGYFGLGNLAVVEQKDQEAEEHYKAAAAIFEELAKSEPDDLENQKRCAQAYRQTADVLAVTKPDEARQWYERALSQFEPLAQQNPRVVAYSIEWAGVHMNLSMLERAAGNMARVRTALERARDILAPLAKRFPTDARCQRDLAVTLRELGLAEHENGDATSAVKNLTEAASILGDLSRQYAKQPGLAYQLAITQRKLGLVERDAKEHRSAIMHFADAVSTMRDLVARSPDDTHRFELALSLRDLAVEQRATADAKAGSENLSEGIEILVELVKEFPGDEEFEKELKAAQQLAIAPSPQGSPP